MSSRLTAVLSALLFWGAATAATAQDLGRLQNPIVRGLKNTQNEDGSYGLPDQQPLATARALIGFGRCSEHYTTQDGPFVRNAVAALLKHQREDGSFADAADPKRTTLTREAQKALDLVAKTSEYDAAKGKAKAFLAALDPNELEFSVRAVIKGTLHERAAEPVTKENALVMADVLIEVCDAIAAAEAAKPATTPEAEKPLPDMPRRAAPKDAAEERARLEQALAYLAAQQKDGQFGFDADSDAGVTAITLSAVIRTCDVLGVQRPDYVAQGIAWLVSLQKEDGGIYEKGLKNYITSVAIETLVTSKDESLRPTIDKAVAFLKATQLDEGEGFSAEDDNTYGGFGYGSAERSDLSNSQLAIDALHTAGVPSDDEAYKKAVEFLRRTQNLKETGAIPITRADGTVVVPGEDGGAAYLPGSSKAGETKNADGTVSPRSYGSMTYALLKSYLFAGIDPNDAKVQAAFGWISKNYTLEMNPGFTQGKGAEYQGYYYYMLTMGRALKAYGQDTIADGAGNERAWKTELKDRLLALQSEDGYWINQRSARWMEGNKVLTTAYALLALDETR